MTNPAPFPRTAVTVRSPWDMSVVCCKRCGCDLFYPMGRSLDLEDWECTLCATVAHTMTETGMSA